MCVCWDRGRGPTVAVHHLVFGCALSEETKGFGPNGGGLIARTWRCEGFRHFVVVPHANTHV